MKPAAAKEPWWKGQFLSDDEFQKLVKERIRAYRVDPQTVVVVVSTKTRDSDEAYDVITCTRPPCWPGHS